MRVCARRSHEAILRVGSRWAAMLSVSAISPVIGEVIRDRRAAVGGSITLRRPVKPDNWWKSCRLQDLKASRACREELTHPIAITCQVIASATSSRSVAKIL